MTTTTFFIHFGAPTLFISLCMGVVAWISCKRQKEFPRRLTWVTGWAFTGFSIAASLAIAAWMMNTDFVASHASLVWPFCLSLVALNGKPLIATGLLLVGLMGVQNGLYYALLAALMLVILRALWVRQDPVPLSMVLLLRKAHFFRDEELRMAAEKAWGISFAERDESKHFVVQSGRITLIKVGPHVLNVFNSDRPYIEVPGDNAGWLPEMSQRQALAEHNACTGVDYMNGTDVGLGHSVIAKLVAEMVDANCTGVYILREKRVIPNDESLYRELQKLASSSDSRVVVGN